jgi:hypothetical protein
MTGILVDTFWDVIIPFKGEKQVVAPITGPFHVSTADPNPGEFQDRYGQKDWYRQKGPYDLPLPYSARKAFTHERTIPGYGTPASNYRYGLDFGKRDECYNKAYSRLVDKLASRADLATTVLERKQAMEMVTNRLLKLGKGFRELRRLEFAAAARTFGMEREPRRATARAEARDFGGLVLEYQLGWRPLVQSIYDMIDVLQNPIKDQQIRARAQISGLERYDYQVGEYGQHYDEWSGAFRVQLGCSVRVSNPNLLLANQMGLVNPVAWIWELTTLSFVVDWIVNVGDVISSWSDFVGFDVLNPYVTYSGVTNCNHAYVNYGWYLRGQVAWTARSPGTIPGPKLSIKPFTGLSWQRGATATSLLLQTLRDPPRGRIRTPKGRLVDGPNFWRGYEHL